MRTSWYLLLVLICVACTDSLHARAQPLFGHTESLESLMANSDTVYIGKLEKFGEAKETDYGLVHDVTISIEETLKKSLFDHELPPRMSIRLAQPVLVLLDWQENSIRLLVALGERAVYETTVIELDPGLTEVMTADFKLLRDPDEVIETAKAALQHLPAGVKRIHTFRLQVPRDLVADTRWAEYYHTSGYLTLSVPVDQRLEKRALENLNSERYGARIEAARALRFFKSEENIAKLKPLLDDPEYYAHQPFPPKDILEERYYGVRENAYQTLKTWGVNVKKPVIREKIRK